MKRIACLATAVVSLTACDPIERLQNDKLLAAVLVESPAVAQGEVAVSGTSIASVFFGTVERGASPTNPSAWHATGISGAAVRITWPGGSVSLAPVPGVAGQYALAGGMTSSPGTPYTFRVESGGEVYSGTVTAPERPAPQDANGATLPVVQAPTSWASLPDPYVLRRAGSSAAFYTVTRLSSQTGSLDVSAPTCTNAPDLTDPLDVLRLLFDDTQWRATSFSLAKAECFPASPLPYAYGLLLTAVNKAGGSNLSSNLFLGSGVVVGSTAASVLPVQ